MNDGFGPKGFVKPMEVVENVVLMGVINRVRTVNFVLDTEEGRNASERVAPKLRSLTDCVKLMEEELDANFQIVRKAVREADFVEHMEAENDVKRLIVRKGLNEATFALRMEAFGTASLMDVCVRIEAEGSARCIVVDDCVK